MSRLHKRDLAEVVRAMPDLRRLDPDGGDISGPVDLFVCALGFEPRCLTMPERLKESGFRCRSTVLCRYSTNLDDNAVNGKRLLANLEAFSDSVRTLEADDLSFAQALRSLFDEGESTTGRELFVVVDVSVMANRLLVKVMKSLLEVNARVIVLYSEAAVYHPTFDEYRSDTDQWTSEARLGLERGVSDVSVSPEYPGYHVDQLPDCILLFPSFKKERAMAVISRVDPALPGSAHQKDKIIWFLGRPHNRDNEWRLTAMQTINGLNDDATRYEVSTFDYRETLETLEEVYLSRVGKYRFSRLPRWARRCRPSAQRSSHTCIQT